MTDRDGAFEVPPLGVRAGYPRWQLAKALQTAEAHEDGATRERAASRAARWKDVLDGLLRGVLAFGRRQPIGGVPAWATLEVVTGGFATGALLAGGPLRDHERALLEELGGALPGDERAFLNAYFLTDAGLARLRAALASRCYAIEVPEEGALLVVAWLAEEGRADEARALVAEIAPFFDRLRFYPTFTTRPRELGARVRIEGVGAVRERLRAIRPPGRVVAQRSAIDVWLPLYDRMAALFFETVVDGWPCRLYPDDWAARASASLREYETLAARQPPLGKLASPRHARSELRGLLEKCARDRTSLTGREVGRLRRTLACYEAKRGRPGSVSWAEARGRQAQQAKAPQHAAIAAVLCARLAPLPEDEGIEEVEAVTGPIRIEEARDQGAPAGAVVPATLRRKVERCIADTPAGLVARGLVPSGDVLAALLPQVTAGTRGADLGDARTRHLDAALYAAFRRRRSLLLFNLERQVGIEELPWVAALERRRDAGATLARTAVARRSLEEVAALAITAFPHAILPNKLLQELRALVEAAGLDLPLTDELATDIFQGRLSPKFTEAARRAAGLLDGTLYARYYEIDYAAVRALPSEPPRSSKPRPGQGASAASLAELCAARAGVRLGAWSPVENGMLLEQLQIVTSHNLAALLDGVGLLEALRPRLRELAERCYRWLCGRLANEAARRHARLVAVKNAAYAWRQMIFFLSLLPEAELMGFLAWANEHLNQPSHGLRERFRPALRGLTRAARGLPVEETDCARGEARRLLGWSQERHWLLAEPWEQ